MTAQEILKSYKLRVTKSRAEVLNIFTAHEEALSSQDLERKLPNADRVTMYRTLKTFEEKGIIHRAYDGTDVMRYALCSGFCNEHDHTDNHVHFHCKNCENTYCLDELEVPHMEIPEGYRQYSVDVIVKGVCRSCNKD